MNTLTTCPTNTKPNINRPRPRPGKTTRPLVPGRLHRGGRSAHVGTRSGTGRQSGDSTFAITYIFYDGADNPKEPDEYVEIKNTGETASIGGYQLHDESGKTYTFPDVNIRTDETVKVFTGCGTDTATELYWCYTQSAIWNNSGDTATLKNAEGNIVSTFNY